MENLCRPAGFYRFLDQDRDGKLTIKEWDRKYEFLEQFKFANGLIAIRPGTGSGGGTAPAPGTGPERPGLRQDPPRGPNDRRSGGK